MLHHFWVKLCKNTKETQSLLSWWEIAHTLRARLQDYIKLWLILTARGISEIKSHKYSSCWQKQLCCATEEGSKSSGKQEGETPEPQYSDKCGPHSPAPQHHTSRENGPVSSRAVSWPQVRIRGTPVSGSAPTRKENPGSKETRVQEKRCHGPFLSQVPKQKAEGSMDVEAPALRRRETGHRGPLGCACMGTKGERGTGCEKVNTDINRQ